MRKKCILLLFRGEEREVDHAGSSTGGVGARIQDEPSLGSIRGLPGVDMGERRGRPHTLGVENTHRDLRLASQNEARAPQVQVHMEPAMVYR